MTTASNPHAARAAGTQEMIALLDEAVDDRTTDADAADIVVDMFDVYRSEPEAIYPILALREGDPPLEIRIAAAGGGRLGAAYANNNWIYGVWLDGALVCSGADLRSGAIAHTHGQMAVLLAEYLADLPPAPPHRHGERLGQWAFDQAHPDNAGDCEV